MGPRCVMLKIGLWVITGVVEEQALTVLIQDYPL